MTPEEILQEEFGHAYGTLHPLMHIAIIKRAMQKYKDQEDEIVATKTPEIRAGDKVSFNLKGETYEGKVMNILHGFAATVVYWHPIEQDHKHQSFELYELTKTP